MYLKIYVVKNLNICCTQSLSGKVPPENFPLGKVPPRKSPPWGFGLGARVRNQGGLFLGGIFLGGGGGGVFPGGSFPGGIFRGGGVTFPKTKQSWPSMI